MAASLAGCGAEHERAPSPGGPAAGDDTAGAFTILAPFDGGRLRAQAAGGGDVLQARVPVRGLARPGTAVFLNADCRPLPCRAQVTTGAQGTWRATLALRVPRAAPFVTIDVAGRRDGVRAGTAVATVELVGPAPTTRPNRPRAVLVVGDSLAEGMAASLRAALPGWRVRVEALTGRALAAGMRILARERQPPAILAISLFTNDKPHNTRALESAVRATATRPGGCAVWSTVVGPPYEGVGYDAANTLLRRLARDRELAPGLELVDWERAVRRTPSLMSGDEVHASPEGYRARGLMYADAIRACAGER